MEYLLLKLRYVEHHLTKSPSNGNYWKNNVENSSNFNPRVLLTLDIINHY